MNDRKHEENPTETAGTVAGRAATISPTVRTGEQASPGAEDDKKMGENQK